MLIKEITKGLEAAETAIGPNTSVINITTICERIEILLRYDDFIVRFTGWKAMRRDRVLEIRESQFTLRAVIPNKQPDSQEDVEVTIGDDHDVD